jgi:RNA polymerase sigma factor (sigma-70 family)
MNRPAPGGRLAPELDAELVARCLAGDPRAWEALVSRHERLVYAVARSYRLSDDDLADVFQDVFAALVRGLPSLRDPRSLVRWLSSTTDRIARTTAFRRRREHALQAASPDAIDAVESGGPPVGADLERLERQAEVRAAFERLEPRCRELLAALYYRDEPESYADVARRLDMAMNSVGPNRARCLDRLRALLARARTDSRTNTAAADTSRTGRQHPEPRRTEAPGTARKEDAR